MPQFPWTRGFWRISRGATSVTCYADFCWSEENGSYAEFAKQLSIKDAVCAQKSGKRLDRSPWNSEKACQYNLKQGSIA